MMWLRVIGLVVMVQAKCQKQEVSWTGGESIDWPCELTQRMLRKSDIFISKNVIATRFAIHGDEAYVAVPRYKPGVPLTLGKLRMTDRRICEARISPYPGWSLQEEGNCASLQNVVDVFLDTRANLVWVLDTGVVNSTGNHPVRRCPPKVAAIDLVTEKLWKTVDLSPLVTRESRLQYLVVEYSPDEHAYVHVSDAANRAILSFEVTCSGKGYRFVLPEVDFPDPDVLYLNLVRYPNGVSDILFSFLDGNAIYSLDTTYLRNGSVTGHRVVCYKKERLVFLGTDAGSAVFFRKDGFPDVYRWDLREGAEYQRVYQGDEYEFGTHVVPDYKVNRMRVLKSNFHDYFQGRVGCGANHVIDLF